MSDFMTHIHRGRPPKTLGDLVRTLVNHEATQDANDMQAVGPDEFPRGYYEHLAVERYIAQYNAGRAAARRGSEMDRSKTSHAWDDGYLDFMADRPKWHLTYCTTHDDCEEI